MAQGYEDCRFEGRVDDNLHCLLCQCVLRDPVRCQNDEHYFCRHCITASLVKLQQCPQCEDSLTVETLASVESSIAETLSELEISCGHKERGCKIRVKLRSLEAHEMSCGFSKAAGLKDECDTDLSPSEIENPDSSVTCNPRRINCDSRKRSLSFPSEHRCSRDQLRELNTDLNEFRSFVQDDIVDELRKLTAAVARIEKNFTHSSGNGSLEKATEIVLAGGEGIKSTIVLNVVSGKWRCLAATYECEGASSVVDGSQMYVTGGSVGEVTNIVKQLDLSQHNAQWIESEFRLPFACRGHTTVLHQNSFYVMGGHTDSQDLALDTVHVIPLTPPHKPELVCRLPEPKFYHGATIVNDKIYIVGGCKRFTNTATDSVIEYDPAKKCTKQLKSLPYPVTGMATANWQNKILAVGGINRQGKFLDSVVMYDIRTQRHHILPRMGKKRAYCTAVVVGNKLIVMGGADEPSKRISSVECYDFQTYTWNDMAPMDEPRAYATAVVNSP